MFEWSKSKKIFAFIRFLSCESTLGLHLHWAWFCAWFYGIVSKWVHCVSTLYIIADSDALCKWCLKQWRIQDFPEMGAPSLQGAPTYNYAKFSHNCMKLKEFGPWDASKILLCRSVIVKALRDISVFHKCFHWIQWNVRDPGASTVPTRHMWETWSLNWAQFMLQWFIGFPEFAESTEGKTPMRQ